MQPQRQGEPNRIDLSKITGKRKDERKRILAVLAVLVFILVAMVVYASFRVGGIQNLISGTSNPFSNIINNTGSAIVNPTATPTPTAVPTEFTIPDINVSETDIFLDREQNLVTFTEFNVNNDYKIKKNTRIQFLNRAGRRMGLIFSDGREVRLEIDGSANELFTFKNTITYYDALDTTGKRVQGTITVVD